MFTRFAIGLLLAAALPLAAYADECLTVHVEHDEYGPYVVQTEGWPEISFPGRMQDDLWFQWDDEPFSVDVSDESITSVETCPDGTVDIRRDTEPSDPVVPPWYEGLADLIDTLVQLSLIF